MPVWLILGATTLYMLGLFLIAWRGDRLAMRPGFTQHPLVYSLALAVYCTSWTYFGAVGTAAASGWDYLAIYLGPTLMFLAFSGIIQRIGDVTQREGISSLSDFLSARYGKSRAIAAAATLAAVAGSLPYIALQLKSVGMSFQALAYGASGDTNTPASETVLLTAIALAIFAILFGTRQSDATRHNSGLMRVLALEAMLKLTALVAVAILSVMLLMKGGITEGSAAIQPFKTFSFSERFVTMTLLSMAAIICLPRQFHVAMIERQSMNDLKMARWVFPLYIFLTCLVVVPITLAGLSVLGPGAQPDLFVLDLPLEQGRGLLATMVFLGGFSAATGMVIISTVALSTMVTNDLVVPAIMQSGRFASLSGDAGSRIVTARRIVIVVLLLLAYAYYREAGTGEALAQIGLLSFAAAAQFAPGLIGAVTWRGGRRSGVLAGLIAGMTLWAYTLFLPALLEPDAIAAHVPGFLHPYAMFGTRIEDSLTHGVGVSLGVNLALFIIISLRSRERLRDRVQAAAFVGGDEIAAIAEGAMQTHASQVSPNGLKTLTSRFLTPEAVDHAFRKLEEETGITASGDAPADWRLVQRTEKLLASALGASSARVVLSSAIGGSDVALPDVLSMLDQKTQAARFERHMLQSMLENIQQGISVVDSDQRLVAWNTAYVELFDYPSEKISVGVPVAELIEHNIRTGWIDGDPVEEARRRVEHMRSGSAHSYERCNPDGRYLRISGNPMPGGGYVTTFSDITDDKLREQALVEANEMLESRVKERTRELEQLTEDLNLARQEAEGANASKTRFLAAASHDLLQPLNAARLYLGSMMSSSTNADLAARADKAIQSADELLKGLLDISRLDHSQVKAVPVKLPLGPLLEDLADEASPMAEKAGLEIRVAPTRLAVFADPDYLKSILRNFISNARRYTSSGGVLVGARRRGNNVRIEVYDTGPGIPADRMELIFEEFRRYEDADNAGIRGAGLGLSVVRRLASLMDAPIDVRSVPGRGSVFSVTVPLADMLGKRRAKPALPVMQDEEDLDGMSVLFVDDEPAIVDSMQRLLESWGCQAVCVRTEVEAAQNMKDTCFDALIADLDLSDDSNGLDLIQRHRARLRSPANVLLLTASTNAPELAAAKGAGIAVLHKPSDPADIRQFLKTCQVSPLHQAAD
ncbi:MAG: hybrid sensor histidine kinase/response regulator [Hyphomonas sp.]|nr:hybrid sensor histidine kinase/response regulator [Hyphomonas sp.]